MSRPACTVSKAKASNSSSVTMPTSVPAPRRAHIRSGCSLSEACTIRPSASTTSAAVIRWAARPRARAYQPMPPLFRQPVTVHNLGGCRMADDPSRGVTGPDGQVHGHPGLYVLDGAVLPGATGANPSMTIAAVAERCIEGVVRRLTGDPGWTAPETAEVVRRAVPEDAAVESVLATDATPMRARDPGIRFRERMRGRLGVPGAPEPARVDLRLTATVPHLALMIADPDHAVALGGTVEVEGLTAGPAPATGRLHLLPAPRPGSSPRGRGAVMDYHLAFPDAGGQARHLVGVKDVAWRRGHGPWRATTRLDARLLPDGADRRRDGPGTGGSLGISPAEVARLALSVRPVADARSSRTARWWTVVRFVAFFGRSVGAALLRRHR